MRHTTKLLLDESTIDIWFVQPYEITCPILIKKYYSMLSIEELKRISKYRFEEDRKLALITRIFIRSVLSSYYEKACSDWVFKHNSNGKPEVSDADLSIKFNLSHTRNLIACAVNLNRDIGVDIEDTNRKIDYLAVAKRYFSDDEYLYLKQQVPALKTTCFWDLWTLKESYIKAVGKGLSMPLNQFTFNIAQDNSVDIRFSNALDDSPSNWNSWLMGVSEQHRLSLTLRSAQQKSAFRFRYFQSIPLEKYSHTQLPLHISSAKDIISTRRLKVAFNRVVA